MTLFFRNHEITVYRQRRVGVTNRHTMSATGTVLPIDITPATLNRLQFIDGRIGKNYVGYAETTANIKVGDEIVIVDTFDSSLLNKRFSVRAVSFWEGFGAVDCKEIDLIAKD